MGSIYFRGAKITETNQHHEDGGLVGRVHFTSDLTPTVAQAMEWEVAAGEDHLLGGIKSVNLTGNLHLSKLTLVPNGGEPVKKFSIDCGAVLVRDFSASVSSARGKKGKPKDPVTKLNFIVTIKSDSIDKVMKYYRNIGSGDGALRLYPAEDDGQLDLQPEEQAEEESSGPALASAREVDGPKPKRTTER